VLPSVMQTIYEEFGDSKYRRRLARAQVRARSIANARHRDGKRRHRGSSQTMILNIQVRNDGKIAAARYGTYFTRGRSFRLFGQPQSG